MFKRKKMTTPYNRSLKVYYKNTVIHITLLVLYSFYSCCNIPYHFLTKHIRYIINRNEKQPIKIYYNTYAQLGQQLKYDLSNIPIVHTKVSSLNKYT